MEFLAALGIIALIGVVTTVIKSSRQVTEHKEELFYHPGENDSDMDQDDTVEHSVSKSIAEPIVKPIAKPFEHIVSERIAKLSKHVDNVSKSVADIVSGDHEIHTYESVKISPVGETDSSDTSISDF